MSISNFRITLSFVLILFLLPSISDAQKPKRWTSGDIHEEIKKLNFLGSALYVAAHPDDENTAMIAYLANEVKARTAYLALTRGGGGQNLLGPELRELLGVIRTQELLEARKIDGGHQMFSRANDFGYSKNPRETFNIWDREAVTADVIWAIRKWKPDIIVNRFDHRTPGRTHGHHTGSAILSVESFELAADPNAFPEQLKYVDPWEIKRTFFNTSWWFYGSREKFQKADKRRLFPLDVGIYYPIRGKSNTEISAESRSMHRTQGFGSVGSRGTSTDYLELIKGPLPTDKSDLFEGVNTTWSRLEGGESIGKMVSQLDEDFKYDNPSASVPALVEIYKKINALPDSYWKEVKLADTKNLIEVAAGFFMEGIASDFSATAGQELEIAIEIIKRSNINAKLKNIRILPLDVDTALNAVLEDNTTKKLFETVVIPSDMPTTSPYWLNEPGELGMYTVTDQAMRGLPETPRPIKVAFDLEIEGQRISFIKDVAFKKRDPVGGEVYRPFEIIPPVLVSVPEPVYVFADNSGQQIKLVVEAGRKDVKGMVKLDIPEGWRSEPEMQAFELSVKGQSYEANFQLFPPEGQTEGKLKPIVELEDGTKHHREMFVLAYDHIATQTVLREASSKIVKIDIQKAGNRIGYIMGAGDAIPQSLEQIGYQVDILSDNQITPNNLSKYDAVIIGIRAYNTKENLKFHQQKLIDYVEQGGTMIVQYNTTRGLKIDENKIGPFPLKLSRDRVAVEEAEVRILKPDHRVLNYPNKITDKDFDGWVQERGLYFPNEWDDKYEAILSSNDPGETPKDGGLLVAQHGKGYYIYSGYSWFRELPAGVPGAYRLFANMISIGQDMKP